MEGNKTSSSAPRIKQVFTFIVDNMDEAASEGDLASFQWLQRNG
jgi:hypothetical protein